MTQRPPSKKVHKETVKKAMDSLNEITQKLQRQDVKGDTPQTRRLSIEQQKKTEKILQELAQEKIEVEPTCEPTTAKSVFLKFFQSRAS